jgi:hypothetical protein
VEGDIVLGHTDLLWDLCRGELATAPVEAIGVIHTDNLDLNIDLDETFAERVDPDETGVHGAVEATELRDETDITLRDGFVWVGAADAARECAHGSNTIPEGVDYQALLAFVDYAC